MKTLKEELKHVADKANTATGFTNRLVDKMRKRAEEGLYFLDVSYIPKEIREEVLSNLQNEYTNLKVEEMVRNLSLVNYYMITWED